jgi:peptidoglycan/xylan/chitin deacetylase (PgdA/CDA1 family)
MRTQTLAVLLTAGLAAETAFGGEPIPERLVVLTFDDSVKSHATVAAPILELYGFGATFFVTEGFNFPTNKRDYMTWEEIRELHQQGFEIGNHTRDHMGLTAENVAELEDQLQAIDDRCAEYGIPKPTSFAWPGNALAPEALAVLRGHGIRFARRGGAPEYPYEEGRGCAYEPGRDHPLLVPSAGDARPDWTLEDFARAVRQATAGRIAVLQFHGVPEGEHPWVHTPRERFEEYMRYLHDHDYHVVALRDLERWVDADVLPEEPWKFIETRPCGADRARAQDPGVRVGFVLP